MTESCTPIKQVNEFLASRQFSVGLVQITRNSLENNSFTNRARSTRLNFDSNCLFYNYYTCICIKLFTSGQWFLFVYLSLHNNNNYLNFSLYSYTLILRKKLIIYVVYLSKLSLRSTDIQITSDLNFARLIYKPSWLVYKLN